MRHPDPSLASVPSAHLFTDVAGWKKKHAHYLNFKRRFKEVGIIFCFMPFLFTIYFCTVTMITRNNCCLKLVQCNLRTLLGLSSMSNDPTGTQWPKWNRHQLGTKQRQHQHHANTMAMLNATITIATNIVIILTMTKPNQYHTTIHGNFT